MRFQAHFDEIEEYKYKVQIIIKLTIILEKGDQYIARKSFFHLNSLVCYCALHPFYTFNLEVCHVSSSSLGIFQDLWNLLHFLYYWSELKFA